MPEVEDFDMEEGVAEMATMFNKPEDVENDDVVDDVVDVEGKVERDEPLDEGVKAEPEEKEPEEAIDLPQSWKKDREEIWNSMSKEAKEYVLLREDQMKNGLEKDRDDATMGRTFRDTIEPYREILEQNNIEPATAVQNLMNAHFRLSTAEPSERKQLLLKMAADYGVDLSGEKTELDPTVQSLINEVNGIKQNLTASQQRAQQAEMTRISAEVEAFADEHPHFDALSDDIAKLIQAGYTDLSDAYEKALWANPVTRQKELERLQKEEEDERAKKAEQEAAEAAKAKAVNIKDRDTHKAPTAKKGKMFDDLGKTYDAIMNREH